MLCNINNGINYPIDSICTHPIYFTCDKLSLSGHIGWHANKMNHLHNYTLSLLQRMYQMNQYQQIHLQTRFTWEQTPFSISHYNSPCILSHIEQSNATGRKKKVKTLSYTLYIYLPHLPFWSKKPLRHSVQTPTLFCTEQVMQFGIVQFSQVAPTKLVGQIHTCWPFCIIQVPPFKQTKSVQVVGISQVGPVYPGGQVHMKLG